jgi:hypothetical protein
MLIVVLFFRAARTSAVPRQIGCSQPRFGDGMCWSKTHTLHCAISQPLLNQSEMHWLIQVSNQKPS